MQEINTLEGLKIAILELEYEQAKEWSLLKDNFLSNFESKVLINIIKGTLKQVLSAPDLKANIIDTALGLTTGFFAKKLLIGRTSNPFKKLLGTFFEIAVANKIANNAESIKSVGSMVLDKVIQSISNSHSKEGTK